MHGLKKGKSPKFKSTGGYRLPAKGYRLRATGYGLMAYEYRYKY